MNSCPNCNAENPLTNKFCEKCGTPLPNNQSSAGSTSQVKPKIPNIKPKNLSKKQKYIIIAAGIAAVLLIAFFTLNKVFNNESELVESLKTASKESSTDQLFKAINFDDYSYEAKQAHEALLEDEENIDDLADSLVNAIEHLSSKKDKKVTVTSPNRYVEYDVIKKKKLGIFKSYEIKPKTVDAQATSTYSKVTVKLDGKDYEVEKDGTTDIKSLLPGEYSYDLLFDTPFGEAKNSGTVQISSIDQNLISGLPELRTVTIDNYNYDELTYFVNDTEIDKDYFDYYSLNIPYDVTFDITAKMTYKGKEFTSEKITVDNSTDYLDFKFPGFDEQVQAEYESYDSSPSLDDYKSEFEQLLTDYYDAYTSGVPSNLDSVVYPESDFYKSQTAYMESLNEKGTSVKFLNRSSLEISEEDTGKYKAKVKEEYEVTKKDGSSNTVTQDAIYTIEYLDGKFYITNLELED